METLKRVQGEVMTKYQEYFQQMLALNKEKFEEFRAVYELYDQDPKTHEKEFNRIGSEVLDIVRDWENKLCNQSESSGFGKFSSKLSEKFWEQVRFNFPKIDYVGVISS